MDDPKSQEPTPHRGVPAEVEDLLRRAVKGDETALPAVRELFDYCPEWWAQLADLSGRAEQALLRAATGENLLAAEALSRRLAVVRSELEGPSPSPPERFLARWTALCWLQAHVALLDAGAGREGGRSDGPEADEAERRLDRAHRRYLMAQKQLALLARTSRRLPAAHDLALWPADE